MLLAISMLLTSGSAVALPERAAWYACLDSYAQVQMMSSKEPPAIVAEGAIACAKERRNFQIAYRRKVANNADSALAAQDFLASKHMLDFVMRSRLVR
jgi:head-tail adaptor